MIPSASDRVVRGDRTRHGQIVQDRAANGPWRVLQPRVEAWGIQCTHVVHTATGAHFDFPASHPFTVVEGT